MLNQLGLTRTLSKMSIPLGVIGAVGGFVSDVMAPLFDFAPAVAGVSFLAFVVSAFVFWRMRQSPEADLGESLMPAVLVLSAGATVIFAGWSLLFAGAPDNGYLAENIEPIAQFQATLLGLEEDVEVIRETTEETAEQVEEIATVQADTQDLVEETADDVDAIATAQAQGFADIQAAFASLQSSQTIVENPTTPQEWYSNARIYQLKGDTANAITAYEGYFSFALDYVDPYQEYANLLNGTQGIARTRQALNDLWAAHPDSLVLDMMTALQLDTVDEQVGRLEMLAQRAPQFGPVFYELGEGYTRQLQTNFTTNMRDRQQEAFEALFLLEEQQGYSRYYIDKSGAQDNLSRAETNLNVYANIGRPEIEFISFYSYEGVTVVVILPEGNAEDLLFSLDDPNPTISTGKSSAGGLTFVNTTLGPIPLEKGDHSVAVKYIDVNGEESAVAIFEYTVDDIVINFTQNPYDFSLDGITAIFTMAVVDGNEDSLYTYKYSIDSDALDQSVQGVAAAGVINTEVLEVGEHQLYVQAIGADGSESAVVNFPFVIE